MKITKSRLLQIIREEVELHEKKWEENLLEFDDEISTEKPVDINNNGEIDDSEANKLFDKEKQQDEESGILRVNLKDKNSLAREDRLFDPRTKKALPDPNNKKQNDI